MSGGSHNYAFIHVDQFADEISRDPDPLRRAFAKHLSKVAVAMRDIEWVDSGDYGAGDDAHAIQCCLGENWKGATYDAILHELHLIEAQIEDIKRA